MPVDINQLIRRYDRAVSERLNYDSKWQQVADLGLPSRAFTAKRTPGEQTRNRIFNDTAPLAIQSLAAAIHGLLSNPALRWMELAPEDDDLLASQEVMDWLYDSTSRNLNYFASPRSGFATNSHEMYLDIVAFGPGVMLVRETPSSLTFQARQLANFYIIEDDEGTLTDTFRSFEATARDIVATWGAANVSYPINKAAQDEKTAGQRTTIVHWVGKRIAGDPLSPTNLNMPWGSVYFELKQRHVLSEGGFLESPYLVPRWGKGPEEPYGEGPAVQVLPSIKAVNAIERDMLVASEQAVRPPVNVFANSVEGPISTRPGSINYIRAGTRDLPQPMNLGTQPGLADKLIERIEGKIEKAFFLDVLQLPDRDRMTAEEIITRRQQGLLKASPVVSRLVSEGLSPMVAKSFNWHLRTGRLLPMPAILRGRRLRVEYTSPMAQSQKASSNQNITAAIVTAAPIVQADPTSLSANLDTDEAFRRIWTAAGADPRLLRRPADARRIRQEIDQQQQLAAAAPMVKDLSVAGKNASSFLPGVGGGVG